MDIELFHAPWATDEEPQDSAAPAPNRATESPSEPTLLLPEITNEKSRSIEVKSSNGQSVYTVNLLEYTCTCAGFVNVHAVVAPRDVGRLCKHICQALKRQKLVNQLDPICQAIVREGYSVYPGRLDVDKNGNRVYITGTNGQGWLNVFALQRKNGKEYFRFGYNVPERRWAYGLKPALTESTLHELDSTPAAEEKALTPETIEAHQTTDRRYPAALEQKIARLEIQDRRRPNSSEPDALALIERVCQGPPTETQLKLAKELGFILSNVYQMSAGGLDDLLALGYRNPEPHHLDIIQSVGLQFFHGDGLGAFVLACMVRSLQNHPLVQSNNDPLCVARACLAAMKDPDYRSPSLTGEDGQVRISWPEDKLQEWIYAVEEPQKPA